MRVNRKPDKSRPEPHYKSKVPMHGGGDVTGLNFDIFVEAVKAQSAPALLLFNTEAAISKAWPKLMENGFAITHAVKDLAPCFRLDLPVAHVLVGQLSPDLFDLIRSLARPGEEGRPPGLNPTLLLLMDCETLEKAEREYRLLNFVELCERYNEAEQELRA